jgi:acetylserotonin O-methyltransferase
MVHPLCGNKGANGPEVDDTTARRPKQAAIERLLPELGKHTTTSAPHHQECHMTAAAVPDPNVVLELLESFRRSKVMFTALRLGVFDHLSKGPAGINELARALGCATDALGRLLGAAVGLGLLQQVGHDYANTPAVQTYLTSTSPRRLTGYARYSDAVLWQLWAHLDDAIREGTHRWKQTYGIEGSIFDSLFRTDEDRREFLMGMHGQGLISSPVVVAAFDLSPYRKLCDLGGATGHLAVAACRRYPTLSAVVFDLPPVLPVARELITSEGMGDRIELVGGDFFTDALPEADLYSVGRILHDWSEPKVKQLLRKIYARLPAGGALLIAEKLLNDDRAGPPWAVLQSLNMLVCTEGKERTFGEYEALLKEAGFNRVDAKRTDSPLDALLATKA